MNKKTRDTKENKYTFQLSDNYVCPAVLVFVCFRLKTIIPICSTISSVSDFRSLDAHDIANLTMTLLDMNE